MEHKVLKNKKSLDAWVKRMQEWDSDFEVRDSITYPCLVLWEEAHASFTIPLMHTVKYDFLSYDQVGTAWQEMKATK